MQALVKSAAHDIERNLLNDKSRCQQALFEAFVRLDARRRGAVVAVGGSAVMSNAIAQSTFEPTEQWLIHEHARYLMCSKGSPLDRVELPGGRLVQLRGIRITVGNDLAGIVVAVDLVSETADAPASAPMPIEPRRSVPAVSPFADDATDPALGESLLWKRAASQVSSALVRHFAVVVRGEPGTGKTTLLRDLFRRLHPDGDCVVVLPDDELPESLAGLTEEAGRPTLVVFAHLELMSRDKVACLTTLLRSAQGDGDPSSVAATVSEDDLRTDEDFGRLLSFFDDSVTLAPLRSRVGDIPLVTGRVLERVTGRRYLAVSAASMRVLKAYDWPGNIPQVEEAMKFAVHNRPVGEIQPTDLPGYCHTGDHRHLSALETSERDIIIGALQDAAGNRVHAATALGISRSSLYRKLKSFGIIAA
jgi:CBS domain-containing protein